MKYELMIRSIPSEAIPEVHLRLIGAMNEIPRPWGFGGSGGPPAPDCGRELLAESKLGNHLGTGFRGSQIIYRHRSCEGDHGMYDDFMVLEFNPAKQQYVEMLRSVLPRYISAFPAYLAYVGDIEWGSADWEEVKKNASNARYSVYRIYPVHYFGHLLCQRVFKKPPEEIIKLLSGQCEHAELLNGGVYLIATSEIIGLEDANQINDRLWKILK